MYVQPLRQQAERKLVPIELVEPEPKVAVLLNANAKRVNDKVVRALSHVVPEGDLYLSKTYEDARRIAQQVVEKRYRTVFTGGGDGTFVGFLNEILHINEKKGGGRLPRFGVLKLGTGNSLANLVGASQTRGEGFVDDVLRARANEVNSLVKLELVETEGKRAPFAGVGVDAGILNHYVELKRGLGSTALAPVIAGGAGYFMAITGKSLPHYLGGKRPEMEVRTRGVAYKVVGGKVSSEPIKPGTFLYKGPALLAAAGSVPCYGYNFKIFPYAQARRGFMHLRVANAPIPAILANLYPSIWNGKWHHEEMHDFLVEDVELAIDQKVPFQIGGDAEGYRDHVRFSMWDREVELLDMSSSIRA